MNKITQSFGMIALILFAVFSVMINANAAQTSLGARVSEVRVNNVLVDENQAVKTQYERDSELRVEFVVLTNSTTTANDVQVEAEITGNKDTVSAITKPFDVAPGVRYPKTLTLDVPLGVLDRDYQLRMIITSPNSDTIVSEYALLISAAENSVAIKDVAFSPNDKVQAGRAFTATVRVKNYGDVNEDDVKVTASIPELGVISTDYLNDLEEDETASSDLVLRVPSDAKSGEYTVQVDVYYNDYDDKTTESYSMIVVGDAQAVQATTSSVSSGTVDGKTTISVGIQEQTVPRGENGVIYPLTLTNSANVAKTYTLLLSGTQDWATTKISPSNVVILNAGETKQVYVYAASNENTAVGDRVFSVDVKEGNNVVQQIPLKASIIESVKSSAWDGLKKALTVGVILLVVLIVVLAAVILYQRRMKGTGNKEDEQIAQTYY